MTIARRPAKPQRSKTAAAKRAKPPAPPQQPVPNPQESSPALEARLEFFSTDLGNDEAAAARFNTIYREHSGDWEAVAAKLGSQRAIKPNAIKKLEFTHHLAAWSGDNVKLVHAFQADDKTNSMRDIAANFSRKEFTQLVTREKAHGKGQTAKSFADSLYNDLYHQQPTAMLKRMVEDPKETPVVDKNVSRSIARFLANQPESFNIKTTSVYEAFKNDDAFKGIAPKHHDQVKAELKSLQRVAAISPLPEVVPVLMKAKITSANMVSDIPEEQFVRAASKELGKDGEAIARQTYRNAVNARIRNEQALISFKEARDGTGIAMIDKAMRHAVDDKVFDDTFKKHNLSWDLLFGDADFCECDECASVYSAAAYFVDLLQYLRNNNLDPDAKGLLAIRYTANDIAGTPLEKLFNRRPDLGCLQLTCENTNTKLPYVDLVNEVMENYVVFQKTKAFNVGRDETSGELLAEPHHTEYKAYETLHDAVYPFTLPYHQPIDAARIYLNHLGTSRYEVIDTFRSARSLQFLEPLSNIDESTTVLPRLTNGTPAALDNSYEEYRDRAADAEYLGLMQEEYVILTKEAFVSKHYWDQQLPRGGAAHTKEVYAAKIGAKPVHAYYGYDAQSEMLSLDEKDQSGLTFVKNQFLQRTGVLYVELVDLLKTQCINPNVPTGQALNIMNSIRFSYRFLQSLVNRHPDPDTVDKKYEKVVTALLISQHIKINNPCEPEEELAVPLTKEALEHETKILKQWVYDYFETVGKIIVLDDGSMPYIVPVGGADDADGIMTTETHAQVLGQSANYPTNPWQVAGDIETCDLDAVRLIHLDGSPLTTKEYDHIHRFIRLWRKLGWTINETDTAVSGLNSCEITSELIHQLVAVKKICEKTGVELTKLLTFWGNINTVGEKSLYKRLFLTHNLLATDSVFQVDDTGRYLTDPTLKISDHYPVLMAALNLKTDDIDAIAALENIKFLTLESVSKLYRFRLLSKILGLQIPDLISVLPLFGNPFTNAEATLLFLEHWERMEDAGFTFSQLNYITRNQDDPKRPFALTPKMALQLAKTLYDGLNAIEAAHQDLTGTEDEKKLLATTELVKEKAVLLYDQAIVDTIVGILDGTTVYSARAPKDIKDLLRPTGTTDYEVLQLDNYPLLRKKIRYDSTSGSLQIKGILTEFEMTGSSDFSEDDITDLPRMLTKLTGSDRLSKFLWSRFSNTGRTAIETATSEADQQDEVVTQLNRLVRAGTLIFEPADFDVRLSEATRELKDTNPTGDDLKRLNRMLLEDAYSQEIVKNQSLEFAAGDFADFSLLLSKLRSTNRDTASLYLWLQFSQTDQDKLNNQTLTAAAHLEVIVQKFNELSAAGTSIAPNLGTTTLSRVTTELMVTTPTGDDLIRLNRLLLEDAYPLEIAKNKRTGLKTILANLQPDLSLQLPLSLQDSLDSIDKERTRILQEVFDREVFATVFAVPNKDDIPKGDISEPSLEPGPIIETAPLKRLRFLEIFLPHLRKELTHRLIVNTLSGQSGLGIEVTDLLITDILKTGAQHDQPVYGLFESIRKSLNPVSADWDGYLIPSTEENYTLIVKGSANEPELSLDGATIAFEKHPKGQATSTEWWSKDPQKLQAGKLYKLLLTQMTPESLYWKTATSLSTGIPSTLLLPIYAEDMAKAAYAYFQKAALLINGFKLSADEIQYLSDPQSGFNLTDDQVRYLSDPLTGFKLTYDEIGYMSDPASGFNLTVDEVQYLSDPDSRSGDMDFNKIQLEQFLRLESYTRLRNSLPKTKTNILEFFKWAAKPDDPTKLTEKIAELTLWKKERLDSLVRGKDTSINPVKGMHFDINRAEGFLNEVYLLRLQKALKVADRTAMAIDRLFEWANPNSGFEACRDIAGSIQHAIRAQGEQEEWEERVRPLNDKLRQNQKNALIAYLLIQTEIMTWGVTDADGLFEYFLIDVQMDPCMETSRIVQANSSVQLFVQRCFLGLEEEARHSGIKPDLLDRGRWDWMQRYRVWEANRKVFLYPENWIESNLRDDKSAFFKELESELLQKDINKQNVEDALKTYLYKVDEVANMEVVGVYIEENKRLHVFSRTRIAPFFFYYRYLDIPAGNWYPWEKMQVDIPSYDMEDLIEVRWVGTITQGQYKSNPQFKNVIGNGCYLIPIVWNDRLLIFFPQFVRKTKSNDDVADSKSMVNLAEDSTSSAKPIECWEIKMAWSEYRNGKWTQKQLSKDALYDIPTATEFWKIFNDASKAKSKYVEAKKKYEDIKRNNGPKWNRWQSSIGTTKETAAWNIYSMAWDQEAEAADILAKALAAHKAADLKLTASTLELPATLFDISRYEFVPVISADSSLLGIEVYYHEGQNPTKVKRRVFEFDGSNIKITNNYSGKMSNVVVNWFHHDSGLSIKSLQTSTNVNIARFEDTNKTLYSDSVRTINFYHADVRTLLGITNAQQLEPIFKFPIDGIDHNSDKDDVYGGYDQDADTSTPNLYHELKRPYSIYNWELFFHTPMMLADALSKSQHFEEAMKWYHYVFNPLADGKEDNRFWQFNPFKDVDARHILEQILNKLGPNQPNDDINEWRNNPFKPHLVARSRPAAYMKWVVMKYVDNLVAWGDYLFRQDTIESINQATQLYVLAGHILGPRPQMIPKRGTVKPQTYLSLLDKWDANSNAMSELELTQPYSHQTPLPIGIGNGVVGLANVFGFSTTTYFCIPNNPKLMGYWDTIADRLFKIRHCENIEGVFRKLPLFEPKIDPALMVKAAAQGISIASVLNDLNTPMPNYRFYYLLQKALELCAELKSMGAAMLSAIEKKDNETIALIRARHENSMLGLVMEIKKQQLEEAQKTLESLQQNRKSPEHRMKYYLQLIGEDAGKVPGEDSDFSEIANAIETPVSDTGLKLIKYEKEDMDMANLSADLQLAAGIPEVLAGILWAIPNIAADVKPFGMGAGATFGGSNLGQLVEAVSKGLQISATYLSHQSASAGKKGGFLRALQDRVMQANAAGYEIKQIDKQILSQQIRIAIANLEITNHQQQIDNALEIEEFLKNKYSNEELYSWMKDSLSTLYHQVYSLAFELAKKAEKVFRFERGLTNSNFIQAGYWDAGYNGLLSGEQLYVGLKQLEAAYHENRGYDYEITKHVSLRQVNPLAILQLKQTGQCEFALPEVLFDVDYPGHYKRRIKSVSITIPCVAGPYVGLNGTLRLLENKFRSSAIAKDYPEKTDAEDDRFQSYIIPINAIAASSGQNDSGMFELNFKDERYLPFEGAGVISRWRFELPGALRQFDYDTISDVVIHIRYTSLEGGASLKLEAGRSVTDYINRAEQISKEDGLFAIIDLKRDFPTQWHQLFSPNQQPTDFEITPSHFPYLFNGRELEIVETKIYLKPKGSARIIPSSTDITLNGTPVSTWNAHQDISLAEASVEMTGSPVKIWAIGIVGPIDKAQIDDFLILIRYRINPL